MIKLCLIHNNNHSHKINNLLIILSQKMRKKTNLILENLILKQLIGQNYNINMIIKNREKMHYYMQVIQKKKMFLYQYKKKLI